MERDFNEEITQNGVKIQILVCQQTIFEPMTDEEILTTTQTPFLVA
jgi:hypothetical protein